MSTLLPGTPHNDILLVIARLKSLWYMDSHLEYIAEVEALFGQLERLPISIQHRLDEAEARICQLEKTVYGLQTDTAAPDSSAVE